MELNNIRFQDLSLFSQVYSHFSSNRFHPSPLRPVQSIRSKEYYRLLFFIIPQRRIEVGRKVCQVVQRPNVLEAKTF